LGFVGLFLFVVAKNLAKRKTIIPVNHPYIEESLLHHNAH